MKQGTKLKSGKKSAASERRESHTKGKGDMGKHSGEAKTLNPETRLAEWKRNSLI